MEVELQEVPAEGEHDRGPVAQFILMHAAEGLDSEAIEKTNTDAMETFTVQFELSGENQNVNEEDFDKHTATQISEENVQSVHSTENLDVDHAVEYEDSGNDDQSELMITHPHPSVVTGLGDFQLRLCEDKQCECGGTGTSVHCPMCPRSETLGDQSSAEEHILQKHWSKRTEVCKDICLLTCYCVDSSAPHVHCPLCGASLPRDQDEDHHLIACINKQKETLYETAATDASAAATETEYSNETSIENDSQSKVNEIISGQSGSLKDRYQKFYHHSMISSLADVQLKPCSSCCGGKKIHCPFCPVSLYRPNKLSVVKNHLESHHWKHRVKFQDLFILKCTAPCKGKVKGMPLDYHWHCPLCSVKVSTKQAMNGHLCAHTRGTQLRHRTNAEWASLLGPEAASVLFRTKSFQSVLETDTDYGGVELQTPNGQDLSENGTSSGQDSTGETVKKKEVFQTVVGLLTKEMMQAIPGSLSVFFSEVQEEQAIQFTSSEDWCLLQGDWKSLTNVHKKLQSFLDEEHNYDTLERDGVMGPGGDATADESFSEPNKEIIPKTAEIEDGSGLRKKVNSSEAYIKEKVGSGSEQTSGNTDCQSLKDVPDNASTVMDSSCVEPESVGDSKEECGGSPYKSSQDDIEMDNADKQTVSQSHRDNDNMISDAPMEKPASFEELAKMGLRSGKAIAMRKQIIKGDLDSVHQNQLPPNAGDIDVGEDRERGPNIDTDVLPDFKNEDADLSLGISTPRPTKRGRGRPRKSQLEKTSLDDKIIDTDPSEKPKRQGAVTSDSPIEVPTTIETGPASASVKRSRGRPRKSYSSPKSIPEVALPEIGSKRKRKPSRKIYENGDLDESSIDDKEDLSTSVSKAKRPNTNQHSAPMKGKEKVDMNSEDDCQKATNKHETPDITISISEETGALLSVSLGNSERDNVKPEPNDEGDAGGVSSGQSAGDYLVKGLSLARKVRVSLCPVCSKVFRDKYRFHQHIFGSNCIKKKQMKDKNFKLPPDIEALVKEVNREVVAPVCPRCHKRFAQLFHAQMHYAARSCTKTAEEKYNGLVMNPQTECYHCRHCDFSSPVVHRVIIHEQRKHMEKTEPCPLCNKLYSSQTLVREHIKAVHAMGNDRTVCEQCGASVATKSLQQHMKIKHDPNYTRPKPKSKKLYICTHCKDFRSTSYSRFFRHRIKAHKDADKACPHCDQKFAMVGELNRHVKFVHEGLQQETSACPQCGKSVTKKNLAAHIRMVHDKIRRYSCDLCGRAFLTKFTLKQHIETHKPSGQRDTKFLCAFCGKGFMNKTHYTDHLNTHTGARPYVCTICNKTFRCCPALAKHKELHKNINLHCTTCDLHFPSRKALRIHNNKEHNTSMFKCVCNAEYNSQETLVAHQRRCGQWQQANPMENHALQQEQQMAMIIQPEEDVASAGPGTYIVMEGKEGEQTVMVLQSLGDLQDQDVVEAITGSEVMTAMTFAGESQVGEEPGIVRSSDSETEQKVMAITESGIVTLPSSDIMTITGQAETSEQLTVATGNGPNENVTLLEIAQDVPTLSLVQEGVESNSAVVAQAEDEVSLNRYLCGYCQRLFTSLDDVQSHMLAEHMASETGEVELALHPPANEEEDIYNESEQSLLS